MSTPQAKRRRLNEATKTLHKPFKSPFRTPLKPTFVSDPPSSDPSETSPPLGPPESISGITQELPSPAQKTVNPVTPLLPRARAPTSTRIRQSLTKATSSQPSLTREAIDLRNDIQMLSQAHALATSSKDSDLLILVERWRTASRAAAEELFATTRDRVNRMGGVGAWKDRENEQKQWKIQAEREELEMERERFERARDDGQVSEDAIEQYGDAGMRTEEAEQETFKAANDDVSCLVPKGRYYALVLILPKSFTMEMMLATLNIDLNLIGYQKEAQRWDG